MIWLISFNNNVNILTFSGILGSSMVDVKPSDSNSTYYNLEYLDGRLTSFPENLCSFPNLLLITFANNFITDIGNVSCLTELNELYVQNNKLTSIRSNAFSELKHLRFLDISNNYIETLEPDAFRTSDGLIFSVTATQSTLKEVDVTNIYGIGFFCVRNMSGSSVDVINKNNFTFNSAENEGSGPGSIYFNSLAHQPFYNFTEIGLDFPDLPKTIATSISFNTATFYCDCSIAPLFKNVGVPGILTFWPALLDNVTCSSPDNLKGVILNQYFTNETLDKLTCNILNYCPWKCVCTDLQNREKVLVNCTEVGLRSLPDNMPTGYWNNRDLEILLDGNDINALEQREWFGRTLMVSFARNPFDMISADTMDSLPDDAHIDLSHLVLKSLPRSIQKKNLNRINFNGTIVDCDCTNTWVGEWIHSYGAYRTLLCSVDGRHIYAEKVTKTLLDCVTEESLNPVVLMGSLISAFAVVVLSSILLHYFRFEIMIIKRRIFRNEKKVDLFQYKAFISFDINDKSVSNWVMRDIQHRHFRETISERLKKERYSHFIPYVNILAGENMEETLSLSAANSEIYIIIFSQNYLENSQCRLEFDIIWKQFRACEGKKIILIEFDQYDKTATRDRRLTALFRANCPLRFEARNDRVIDRLLYLLSRTKSPQIDQDPVALGHVYRPGQRERPENGQACFRDINGKNNRNRRKDTLEMIELEDIPNTEDNETNHQVADTNIEAILHPPPNLHVPLENVLSDGLNIGVGNIPRPPVFHGGSFRWHGNGFLAKI